jgi:predicted MFS family arabinose efflux permease
MRILFSRLVPAQRDAAFAVITITQELGILLGPVIVGAALAAWSAPAALVVIAAVTTGGTLWFALAPHAREVDSAARVRPAGSRGRLLTAGLAAVLAVASLFGAALGAGEVAIPAFAIEHGDRTASGLLVAAMSVGGVAGGLWLGALDWSAPASARATLLLALVAAGLSVLAVAPSLLVIALLLVIAGCPLNPAITNIALVVDERAPRHATAQAFGWMSTAVALGASLGSAIAGPIAQHAGSDMAFLLAGAVAGMGALVGFGTRRRRA